MNFEPHRCGGSLLRNQRTRIEARRRSRRRAGPGLGNQGSAAVVIASATYLAERPDAVVGILTTKLPRTPATTDYVLQD
jgi:hypothetical protein